MPDRASLSIYQGDDYAATIQVNNADGTPADLTGYTPKAQLRRKVADEDPEVILELTLNVQSPNIYIAISHDQTTQMNGGYIWDLQLTENATGVVTTILKGPVSVEQEVTREASVSAAVHQKLVLAARRRLL